MTHLIIEKNLTINGVDGNTIEFWIKSNESSAFTKAIFDAWNSDGTENTAIGSASYGRMLLETRVTTVGSLVDNSLFHLTYMSGTAGAERVPLFSSVSSTFVNDKWYHIAVSIKNSGNELSVKSYMDGELIDNLLTGSSVSDVTGSANGGINANINAYINYPTNEVKDAALAAEPL